MLLHSDIAIHLVHALPYLMPAFQGRFSSLQNEPTDVLESISRVVPPHTFTSLTDHILPAAFTVIVTLPQTWISFTRATRVLGIVSMNQKRALERKKGYFQMKSCVKTTHLIYLNVKTAVEDISNYTFGRSAMEGGREILAWWWPRALPLEGVRLWWPWWCLLDFFEDFLEVAPEALPEVIPSLSSITTASVVLYKDTAALYNSKYSHTWLYFPIDILWFPKSTRAQMHARAQRSWINFRLATITWYMRTVRRPTEKVEVHIEPHVWG